MVKNRKQLLKTFGTIMGVSCLLAVGFTVSNGNNVEAKAETGALGISWTDTKYKVSQDGEYAIIITAFKADDVLANTENKNYIIGYEINGEDKLIEYGKNYYESVSLKTSETESVSYTAAQVFGDDYADYKLNVYEINEFDVNADYTVQPFIKEITLDGENGYTAVAEDLGAENTIDVKTVTFDTNGGNEIATMYVQNGATFGQMPTATKADSEFSRWSEDLTGKTITENVTVTAIWKETDISELFSTWKNHYAIRVNDKSQYMPYTAVVSKDNEYKYAVVDLTNYQGRTLSITLPTTSAYGMIFTTENHTTTDEPHTDAAANNWAYGNADGAEYVEVTIPTIESGNLYIMVSRSMTAETDFSAKVLDGYTVTFDTKGGTEIPSQFVWYGEMVQVPENPTITGATFQGWDIDLTQPVTGAMTVTAIYKYEDQDISSLFTWTNHYAIRVKDGNQYLPYTAVVSQDNTYKYAVLDVTNYQGRTLRITLPAVSTYGMIFTTQNHTTTNQPHTDAAENGWVYGNADKKEYVEVTIPTIESGNLYIMVSRSMTATTDFSAIILGN